MPTRPLQQTRALFIPEELYRRIKARAALDGQKIGESASELIEHGLKHAKEKG
jgi:hypothetical protein